MKAANAFPGTVAYSPRRMVDRPKRGFTIFKLRHSRRHRALRGAILEFLCNLGAVAVAALMVWRVV